MTQPMGATVQNNNYDIHVRLVRIEEKVDHVLDQVKKINGRVSGLENWRRDQEIESARAEGRSEAVLKKSHVYFILGAVPAVSAVIGLLSRYFI